MRYILLLITIMFCVSLSAQSNPYRTRLYRDLVEVNKRFILSGTAIDSILMSWDTAAPNDVTLPTTKWVEHHVENVVSESVTLRLLNASSSLQVLSAVDTLDGSSITFTEGGFYSYEFEIYYNVQGFPFLEDSISIALTATYPFGLTFPPNSRGVFEADGNYLTDGLVTTLAPTFFYPFSPSTTNLTKYIKFKGYITISGPCVIHILGNPNDGVSHITQFITKAEKLQ